MAMVVQHNLTAMNANRQLGITSGAQAKSSEKLSSGYRINRAGDDAAGLKISEKMRSQIRGLDKASSNAQDGVSLIQTAEGALNEAHSILQRMNELAVQGANDTNQSIDRDAINEELSALTTELDRISETTQFNKQNLLDGTFSDKKLQVGANAGQKIEITIGSMNAKAIGLSKTIMPKQSGYVKAKGVEFETSKFATSAAVKASAKEIGGKVASKATAGVANGGKVTIDGREYKISNQTKSADGIFTCADMKKKIGCVFANKAQITVKNSVPSDSFMGARVDTYEIANATITKVQDAINNVSSQRSALGALQNRLEHTIANLDNVSENTSAAESRIRDTDMASEMVNYSKNNILAQAGQSMLAQANQSTQGVLSLLQ